MADDQQQNDAVRDEQNVPRTGIPGKGFDAGTGYGGAGNDALYNSESAFGGQSAQANNSLGGAYKGEGYGRPGDDGQDGGLDASAGNAEGGRAGSGNVARDTDGRGSENQDPDRRMDPNTEAVTGAFEGAGSGGQGSGQGGGRDDMPAAGISRDGPDTIDLQDFSGASRREPGR